MSNNIPNDGSLETTKQMLDELDALMDRMLSLPVNELEETPTVGETPSVMSAKLTILEPPVEKPKGASPRPRATPATRAESGPGNLPLNPPHFTLPPTPAAEPVSSYLAPPPAEPAPLTNEIEPLSNAIEPASLLPTLEPLLAGVSEPAASLSRSWLYGPLVWINRAFDRVALLVPVAGTWLRTHHGRTFLGGSGLVLAAAALGWLLKDWLGWNR